MSTIIIPPKKKKTDVRRRSAAEVSRAARAEFDRSRRAGLTISDAEDNARERVRELVGMATGFFDSETMTWTYDG